MKESIYNCSIFEEEFDFGESVFWKMQFLLIERLYFSFKANNYQDEINL